MGKWTGLTKRITAAAAEAETDHLFDRPPPKPSAGTVALLKRVALQQDERNGRRADSR